jgi:uncharacterized protein YdeI (YjbR/CyaY-like superfamily)
MAAPKFFKSASAFRRWLEAHHDSATELVVGFHRVETGKPSMTWTESVREALCFGWIDGLVKRIDDTSYSRRFTPRKPSSIWSAVNVKHVESLIAEGRMTPAGLAAFAALRENRSGVYSFEQRSVELSEPFASTLRADDGAWTFWETLPASYRKAVAWWVVSAKQEVTRHKRCATLVSHCAKRERIPQFTSRPRSSTDDS